ncbi:cell wall hydrolase [Rubellimicrobium rubrum]|uniref:Cell wall hydrolase n=1 Tax=Rubellimicrobium rubrum TaxID=2585369 RepID=A0A5C4MUY6_9RHOB|nr:cell wall hydrolase [Rubellimicrobium rubrum]TNC48465.1 cell wall hydrolase [Rubellimicrobium rubrum]
MIRATAYLAVIGLAMMDPMGAGPDLPVYDLAMDQPQHSADGGVADRDRSIVPVRADSLAQWALHEEAPYRMPALQPKAGPDNAAHGGVSRPRARPFVTLDPLVVLAADPSFGPKARPAEPLFRPQARPADLLVPDPPTSLSGADDLLCMAVAIYHEARDQPLDGQLAVASVILNRTGSPARWGDSPCAVVQPIQFSFLTSEARFPPIDEPEAWAVAVEMAREAIERGPSPVVGGADHYHTPAVDPSWDEDMMRIIRIDDHIFYTDATSHG